MTTTMTAPRAWACPDAELILPLTASRTEWLTARRSGIGGSDMGALMNVNPYRTQHEVWLDKLGRLEETEPTKRMQRGSAMEPIIATEFAAETGLTFRRAGLQRSRTYPHLLGNVDRLADDGGGVEIKRTDSYGISKKILAGEHPAYWFWQCLTYLAVTGRSHWWLVAMMPMRDDLWVQRIDADDHRDQIAGIGPMVETWWQDHILAGIAPAVGAPFVQGEIAKGTTVEAIFPHRVLADIARWRELNEIGSETDIEIDQIKQRLAIELGTAGELAVAGRSVCRWAVRAGTNRFDRKRLKAEQPAVERQYSVIGEPTRSVALMEGR